MFKKLKDWMFPTLPEPEVDMILEDRMWGDWTIIEIVRVSTDKKWVKYNHIRTNGKDRPADTLLEADRWKDIYISYKIQENKNV
tara:strand:- start:845 stop:1096 length:252 start_codon:yes stop_codon:yes gene_type:complete